MFGTEPVYDQDIWGRGAFPDPISTDEDILAVVRHDISIIAFKAMAYLLVVCALLLIRTVIEASIDARTFLIVFDGLLFGIMAFLVSSFTLIFHNYYLSMGIVTDKRVIDIDQVSLFRREVNEMDINNAQDITYKQTGFWGTILDFGNVIVQTAGGTGGSTTGTESVSKGEVTGFVFSNVPSPKRIANLIARLYQAEQDADIRDSAKAHANEMAKLLKK